MNPEEHAKAIWRKWAEEEAIEKLTERGYPTEPIEVKMDGTVWIDGVMVKGMRVLSWGEFYSDIRMIDPID